MPLLLADSQSLDLQQETNLMAQLEFWGADDLKSTSPQLGEARSAIQYVCGLCGELDFEIPAVSRATVLTIDNKVLKLCDVCSGKLCAFLGGRLLRKE